MNTYIIQQHAGRNGHWEEREWNKQDPHYNNEFHICYQLQNPVSDRRVSHDKFSPQTNKL